MVSYTRFIFTCSYTAFTGIDLSQANEICCKMRISLLYVTVFGSLGCICLTGFDRWVSTSRSVRRRNLSSKCNTFYAILILFIISILCDGMLMFITARLTEQPRSCGFIKPSYADYGSFFFFPVIFGISPVIIPLLFVILNYKNVCTVQTRLNRFEKQFTRMIILQLIALILASIPYAIYYLYMGFTRRLIKDSLRLAQENIASIIVRHLFSTLGVGPCVGFVVLLDQGQLIFIEHRGPDRCPSKMNLDNVRMCLEEVASHVTTALSSSIITNVWIFGGVSDNKMDYEGFQENIEKIIKSSPDNAFFKHIKHSDVCFNFGAENPENGEAYIDLIVDVNLKQNHTIIYVVQTVKKFLESDATTIRVLAIDINKSKCYFMVDISNIENNQNKTVDEIMFINESTLRFRSRVDLLNAEELKDDMATQLFNSAKELLSKALVDEKHQTSIITKDDENDDKDTFDSNFVMH
ncbi:hypothetical protein I4U23_028194 [Adineta vaga]|nr:hypothetical protein I4U23_028194 [Adineta vaga]